MNSSNEIEISEDELELFALLSTSIAACTMEANGFSSARQRKYKDAFHHRAISIWEEAFNFLRLINVFETDQHELHRLRLAKAQIASHVGILSQTADQKLLDRTICIFIGIFVGERHTLPASREAFLIPSGELQEAVNALLKTGYLAKTSGGWIWTEKIRPAMEENYLWIEDGSWHGRWPHRLFK